jgi:site-specific DNA recombinase
VTDRPAAEWLHVPAPHLRIVPEPLWQSAHARIAAARGKTYVRAKALRESNYLLPGLARCAWCNGGLHVRTRRRAAGDRLALYACTSHYNRGETVCSNHVQFPMDLIDRAVLNRIDDIMTPDLVDDIIARVRELLDPGNDAAARERLEQQIAAVDRQAENLADAIAIGGDVPALVKRLSAGHQRRQELVAQREASERCSPVRRVNWGLVERQARALLADWRGLLSKPEHVQDARPVLRELLDGAIRFTPIIEEQRRGYRFDGGLKTGAFLAGIIEVTNPVLSGVPGRI